MVREAARRLGEFSPAELADAVPVKTWRQRRQAMTYVQDFVRRGEMVRIAPGRYRYRPLRPRRSAMDVIWHLVRSNRRFDLDDIERLSGAKRVTVQEYIGYLVRAGFVKREGRGRYRLVKDPGPKVPVNTGEGKRARLGRAAKGERPKVKASA